ncbi:hypothetical protein V1517DRAFT_335303 [Lipomyces orientalis]|uniref:Uncharacterized protein n=1 Tax=Lipomyces orientalis TaxID=1233043 RepID=A0ACC3TXZ7_9ASCO
MNHGRIRREGNTDNRNASSSAGSSSATSRRLRSRAEVENVVDLDEVQPSGSQPKRRRVVIDAETEDVIELNDDSSLASEEDGLEEIDEVEDIQLGRHHLRIEKPAESSSILSEFACVICFDQPDILAATPCGHLYCYDCIFRALSAGAKATATTGECSVCRRKVPYKRVLPLEMKLGEGESDEVEEAAAPGVTK